MPMPTPAQFMECACDELRGELHKLDKKIIVTNDGRQNIQVYSKPEYKAYVPKNYDGWPVKWSEVGEELTIDLDEPLHGIGIG